MRFNKIIICICIAISSLPSTLYASESFESIESQINARSSEAKVEKLQKFLQALELYDGEINGQYEDVEDTIFQYQKKHGLVQGKDDWGAGYFGRKTLVKMEEEFQDDFVFYAQKYLKQEEIKFGKQTFVVTAYYSPLPNQKRYVTGSYAGDIRLNGSGKITASGKGVFPGLIAAPRNYKFGTKIYFEGIGVGVVEDRGGAIVNAGDRGHHGDRIDIWMGKGDEGLTRALKWGQRNVEGEVLPNYFTENIRFDRSILSKYEPLKLSPVTSSGEQIRSMQKMFQEMGLYKGSIDGNYNSLRETVVDYQVDNGIIVSESAIDAGYIGPSTAAFLYKKYPNGIFIEQDKYSLPKKEAKKLDNLSFKIIDILNEKYKNNTEEKTIFKKRIKMKIERAIESIDIPRRKIKLYYILDNIR